jgi:hypothetical protein
VVETIGPVTQPDGSVLVGRVIWDPDGADFLDCPRDDNSGEEAWEWIEFDDGAQRNEWIAEQAHVIDDVGTVDWFRPGLDFWIERYEHGLVRYAPTGEASMIDRQWDVAPGVAILRFKENHGCGDPNDPDGVLNFVRAVCDEYTAWCNGDIYGYAVYRWPTIAHYETDPDDGELIDACWGFIGGNDHGEPYALEALKEAMS